MLRILGGAKHNKMVIYLEPINGNYLKRNISQSSFRGSRSPHLRFQSQQKGETSQIVSAKRVFEGVLPSPSK